jgi:hypothetical protein
MLRSFGREQEVYVHCRTIRITWNQLLPFASRPSLTKQNQVLEVVECGPPLIFPQEI